MTVHELNRDQLVQLKQDYLCQLADCGEFAEIVGVYYDEESYVDFFYDHTGLAVEMPEPLFDIDGIKFY